MHEIKDQVLSDLVRRRLMEDTRIAGQSIEVVASGGYIQLKGIVDTEEEKQLAIDLAEGVPGVRHVESILEVRDSEDE